MEKAMLTRRRLLQRGAGAAAFGAAASLMPPRVRDLLAQTPNRRGSLGDIKHVVLLMQENRSFDHYFGTLAGVRGFGDPKPQILATGRPVFYQPDAENPDGYLLPFHLDTRISRAQKVPSVSHAWSVQHAAWNHGRMDQWLPAHRKADGRNGPYCMGYYTREDIPFQFALAEAFTLCDNYHCSVLGPTGPNRMYWMTGTIDPEGAGGGPMLDNAQHPGGYTWKTYAERLQEAGISWQSYQQEGPHAYNMLPFFRAFQEAPKGSTLYQRGVYRGAEGHFEYDALHDKLPTVSWLFPMPYQSEHPDSMPADGAAYVAGKIDALAANPDVWAKTLLILSYDENDGIFDHVAPPTPAVGTAREFVDGLPIGAGFRVPCLLISPWTTGGWVCSDRFDHTSVLQFLERFTGVREPNISAWRRRTFGDFTSALPLDSPRKAAPPLPDTSGPAKLAAYEAKFLPAPKIPEAAQTPPRQERHRKPAS